MAALAFSLSATKTQKTHLKWERALVQLNVQIDSTRNQSYLFIDCRKRFVLLPVSQFALLTAAILPDVLPLSPAEGTIPGGKEMAAHTLYTTVISSTDGHSESNRQSDFVFLP